MKIFYSCSLILASLFIACFSNAQEPCKVLMLSIADRYEGDCKKNKAHGSGKAEGIDQYLGEFKNGLPDGKGIYHWKNGNFYEGEWTNGKKNGEGGMAYKRSGKMDSIVTGFWEKDRYMGKYEKPFKVYNRTLQVTKSEVKFESSKTKEITILASNTTGNIPSMSGKITPKATLNEVALAKGSYLRLINLFDTSRQTAYKLESVTYPLRAKFRIGSQEVDVEFFEEGKFTLDIVLNN